MKKVCLITSEESFLTNFGAALQGYALYSVVKNKGYDINIQRYLGGEFLEANKKDFTKIFRYSLIEIYLKLLFRFGKYKYRKKICEQRNLFKEFQNELMSFYTTERKNWDSLKLDYPKADIYLCGSDQIWNPSFKNGYNDPGYFLNFVNKNKIAYAPSFGVSDIPETSSKDLAKLLKDFDFISVREEAGAEIIKKYTGKNVKVVLDPTLLLEGENWKKLGRLPENIPKKYILRYGFGNSLEVNKKIQNLSKDLDLPILTLPLSGISYFNSNEKKLFNVGPREFIGLIENATLVCTDSFHATVFSILLETPFITFLRGESSKKGEGMNSRIFNLLEITNLKNRISENIDLTNEQEILTFSFDYAKKAIYEKRKESLEWLEKALKIVGEK